MQNGYQEYVRNHSKNFESIRITSDVISKVSEFVQRVISIKLQEKHHFIDNSQEAKRWTTGYLGEFAVEAFLETSFVDLSIGSSKKYFISDMSTTGVDWGIKTVEYGKFPVIFKKSFKDEVIVIKKAEDLFYICGLATKEILNEFQSDKLILSPGLRAKGTKTGFYGFEHLINPNEMKDRFKSLSG